MTLRWLLLAINVWLVFFQPWLLWSYYCTNRTGTDLNKLYESLRFRPVSGLAILNAAAKVSFKRHLWARMLFRDPWALYDPIVADAIKNPRTEIIGVMTEESPDRPPAVH